MSESSETAVDAGGSSDETADAERTVSDYLREYYQYPTLGALIGFFLWVRLRAYDDFIVDGEVAFRGNDPWYHFRETTYAVENYPTTIPFDPWTGFPFGRLVGQFGTLFDQITATVILIVTLGSGDQSTAMRVMLVMAPLFAAVALVPAYLICRRFAGRAASLLGMAVLVLLPGQFLSYTIVGFYDHHAAEILFQTLGVLAFLVAFAVAEREKPVWELVVDRDFRALRGPTRWAVLAGVAVALYMYTWQPGVIIVGFTGIFVVLKMTSDVVHGGTPEPTAYVASVSMTVAGVLMVLPLNVFDFGVTDYSLTQVCLPLAVAGGAVFLAWLARQWEDRNLDPTHYPVATFAAIGVSVVALAVLLPDVWGTIQTNLLRTVGFSAGAETRTIGEAQPLLDEGTLRQQGLSPAERVIQEYGYAFFVAVAGLLTLLGRGLVGDDKVRETGYFLGGVCVVGLLLLLRAIPETIGDLVGVPWQIVGLTVAAGLLVGAVYLAEYDATELYLIVWAGFITCMAFTQVRFNYYLAIVVAVLTAYFLQWTLGWLSLADASLEDLRGINGWQAMTLGTVLVLLFVPFAVGVAPAVWDAGEQTGPGAVVVWDDSLEWLSDETPLPGELEGEDNGMELYDTFDRPADGDFSYPDGAYGVQSWWDYGHWITAIGERIPNANPFQQGATEAANFLLAPGEDQAAEVLERQSDEGGNTRYVMVDWQMVTPGSKFEAPTVFYDEDPDLDAEDFRFLTYERSQGGGFQPTGQVRTQRYYESLMVRLYEYHGSAQEPAPIVVQWEEQTVTNPETGEEFTIRVAPSEGGLVRQFNTTAEARAFAENRTNAQVGGIGPYPSERVEALEHYRLVKTSEQPAVQLFQTRFQQFQRLGLDLSLFGTQTQTPQWVKTFERVPGATIEGDGARPNATVTARVQMQDLTTGENFTYTQQATADENGEFELTVPYSTAGYDEFGPENGYTNVSVRATGAYSITGGLEVVNGTLAFRRATTNVSEAAVVGEDTEPIEVTLELPDGNGTDDGQNGNGTDDGQNGNGTDDGQNGNGTDDGQNGGEGNETARIGGPAELGRAPSGGET